MKQVTFLLMIAILVAACSKKDKSTVAPGTDTKDKNYAPGVLYIKQGTEGITRFDLSNGVVSDVLQDWYNGSGWDISWDGTKGVKEVNQSSYDTRYIIFDVKNGSTIREIFYEPNDNNGGLPYFSPDGTRLALCPTFEDGLVILDMNGKVIHNIAGYGATHEFKFLDPICWEAGGTILFKKDGGLWRTTTDFKRAIKIRDIPFDDWRGYTAASPDGKKIALSLGNYIWLMNADGSDFHVITESTQWEAVPVFSPDSKYIAMKANSRAGDGLTTAAHICIIPADGQVYKVWPGEDNRVIHPMEKGAPDSRGLGKTIVGDFVWR